MSTSATTILHGVQLWFAGHRELTIANQGEQRARALLLGGPPFPDQ